MIFWNWRKINYAGKIKKSLSANDTGNYRYQDGAKASYPLRRSRYPDAFSIPRFGHCKLRSTSGMRTRRSDRILTLWILPKNMVHRLFSKMNETLSLKKRGRGIAVSVPLRGVQVNVARFITEQKNGLTDEIKQEENKMAGETAYSMIIATVNQGYSDELLIQPDPPEQEAEQSLRADGADLMLPCSFGEFLFRRSRRLLP